MMVGKVTPNTMMSASRIPALLGLSRWSTRNDELQLSINAIDGIEPETKRIEAADWGNRLENIILREAAERLQLRYLDCAHLTAVRHPIMPLAASLDGTADGGGQVITSDPDAGIYVVGQDSITLDGTGVLESKLTGHFPEDVPALERGPLQLQAQMEIIKAKWGAVCVLYQGTELRIFLFAPHQATVDAIIAAVWDFDRRLLKYKEVGEIDWYPPEGPDDIQRMHPVAREGQRVTLPPNAAQLVADIERAEHDMDDAKSRKTKAETELKQLIGSAVEGVIGHRLVRWPMRSYKATPERIVPAKEAYTIRQSTLSIKALK
jgi:predicted phage-related endonuclease